LAVVVKALGDESTAVRDSACQTLAVMKAAAKEPSNPSRNCSTTRNCACAPSSRSAISARREADCREVAEVLDDKDGDTQLWSAFALGKSRATPRRA